MSQEPDSRKRNESPDRLLEGAKSSLNRVLEIDSGNSTARIFLDLVHAVETIQTHRHRLILCSQITSTQSGGLTDPDPDISQDGASQLIQGSCMIGNAPKRTKRGEHVIRQAAMQRYEAMPSSPAAKHNGD